MPTRVRADARCRIHPAGRAGVRVADRRPGPDGGRDREQHRLRFDGAYGRTWQKHSRRTVARCRAAVRQHRPARDHRDAGVRPAAQPCWSPPSYGNPARHGLFALDFATGAVRWHHSLDLPGVERTAMQERGALTIVGGHVCVPFGGLAGDCGGYKGRVVGVRSPARATRSPTPSRRPARRASGRRPGRPSTATDDCYVSVGNGESGVGDPYDFSDSVLKLGRERRCSAVVFSPTTWPTDNDADLDLGSQGPGCWSAAAGCLGRQVAAPRTCCASPSRRHRWRGSSSRLVPASFGGTAVSGRPVYVPCADGVRAVRTTRPGRCTCCGSADSAIAGSPVIGGGRVWTLAGRRHAPCAVPGNREFRASVGVGADQPVRHPGAVRQVRPRRRRSPGWRSSRPRNNLAAPAGERADSGRCARRRGLLRPRPRCVHEQRRGRAHPAPPVTPPETSPSSVAGADVHQQHAGAASQVADWPTYHGDAARTGVSTTMPPVAGRTEGRRVDQARRRGVRVPDRCRRDDGRGDRERHRVRVRRRLPPDVEAASRHSVTRRRAAVRQHRSARHHRHAGVRRGERAGLRRARVRRPAAARGRRAGAVHRRGGMAPQHRPARMSRRKRCRSVVR